MSKIMNAVVFDNNSGFGGNLVKYLNRNGCEAVRTDIEKPIRKSELKKISPNIFLIALDNVSHSILEKIRKLKAFFPDAKILITSYLIVDKYLTKLIENGADRCIIMPAPIFKIYKVMMELCGYQKIFKFENYISTFLIKNGFPSSTINFKYFCSAICFCVLEPKRRFYLPILYQKVADANRSTSSAVEHSIRRISKSIYKNGAYKNISRGKTLNSRLTNYELLTLTTDKFMEYYNIQKI